MDSLHIYAQQQRHDSCHIVGTWSELVKLREAINRAIESQQVASGLHTAGVPSTGDVGRCEVNMFVNDGECYTLVVQCVENMDGMAVPYIYTDDLCRESGENATWPWSA